MFPKCYGVGDKREVGIQNYLQVFEVGDDVEVFEIEAVERDQGEFEQGVLGVGQHLFEA